MFSRQKRVGAAKLRTSLGSRSVLRSSGAWGGKDGCVETHPGYLVADTGANSEEVVGKIKKTDQQPSELKCKRVLQKFLPGGDKATSTPPLLLRYQ